MKVCLFGGTFDPPHLGHLIIAQTIFEAEKFDQIVCQALDQQAEDKELSAKSENYPKGIRRKKGPFRCGMEKQ